MYYNNRETLSWNWNAVLNYSAIYSTNHYFDAIVGIETRLNKTSFNKTTGKGFEIYDRPQAMSKASKIIYKADSDENTGRSFFSQLNYNYNKTYYILLNGRMDQSSAFGDDRNTSFNAAVGASWIVSNMEFMNSVNWINHLKLRSSFGSSGNSKIGSYRAKGLYTLKDYYGSRGYNSTEDGYAYPYSAPNPDLGWESNYKFDSGIELQTSFRLNLNILFYNDNIKDMIVSRQVPYETGYDRVQINGADMYNRGIEMTLGYIWIDRENFFWKSNFNVSTLKNKITYLVGLGSGASEEFSTYATQVGKSSTAIWGYDFAGVDPATGRELYNVGDITVDNATFKSKYQEVKYREIIGDTQPDYYGGLNNHFTFFKRLNLRINMSYKIGAEKFVDDDKIDKYNILKSSNIGVNAYYQAWRQAGDITGYGAITGRGVVSNSSKYLYSTSHIKLQRISLSYSVPLRKSSYFKTLTLNATGSNLYYWFFQKSPEGQNGIKEYYKTYPEMRSFTFGINTSF